MLRESPEIRFVLDVGLATDVGKMRKRNEDSLAIYRRPDGEESTPVVEALLLVADGMGGERGGDRASQMAAEGLHQCFASGFFRGWPESQEPDWPGLTLRRAIREVNGEIFGLGQREPSLEGLGSTVVIALLSEGGMTIAHVGDSRCYRVRGEGIDLLTRDHTWVERQVEAGLMSRETARAHPNRNILTRSLGDPVPPECDVRTEALEDGDIFVLCSDGLTGRVGEEQILRETRRVLDPQRLAERLVDLANTLDGSDNITVVVGRCREVTLAEILPEPGT
jgi:protein phosphatase